MPQRLHLRGRRLGRLLKDSSTPQEYRLHPESITRGLLLLRTLVCAITGALHIDTNHSSISPVGPIDVPSLSGLTLLEMGFRACMAASCHTLASIRSFAVEAYSYVQGL